MTTPDLLDVVRLELADGQSGGHRTCTGTSRSLTTFPSNPAHLLILMLDHDANHRGQIVALLRQSGYRPEQLERLEEQWDIWRE